MPARRAVGVGLVGVSVLLYAAVPAVALTSLSVAAKAGISSVLVIAGEVAFWAGGVLLGMELLSRFRRVFRPRRWFRQRGDTSRSRTDPEA